MSLGRRLINTGGVAACTTDTADVFGDSNGIALYTLDYDASDASGTYDGTPTDVTFGVGGQINYGARFNGSSSYIESGISTDILNSDYTISFWGKSSNSSGSQTFINTNSGAVAFVRIDFSANGNLYFYHRNSASTAYSDASIVSGMADGNWHHVVITKDNTSVKAYKDGSLVGTITSTSGTYSNSTTFQFGRNNYNTNGVNNFNGDIDQVRIFNRALDETTDGEISALYAETACVYTSTTDIVNYPTGTTPVAYYKFDNSSEDFSTGGNDGTDTNIEYRFGRYGQAAVFNGSSSKIDISSLSLFDRSSFAISCWAKSTNVTTTGRIIGHEDTGGSAIIIRGDDVIIDARDNGASASITLNMSTTNNQWHHICLVNDSNHYYLYLDGVEVDDNNYGYNPTASTAGSGHQLAFGYRKINNDSYWSGDIDQVRIYSTALSSSQVTELYNEKPETDTSTFKTVLYTGDGGTQYISNVGFQPDLVWVKNRDVAVNHYLYDSIRGTGAAKALHSNTTDSESSASTYSVNGGVQSIDSNGFTVFKGTDNTYQGTNKSGNDYVAWVWKAGGDDVLNEVGDIDSQVSANTSAGFSIVKYTGNGISASLQKVGTGLNQECDFVVIKNLDNTASWVVQTNKTDVDKYLYLNDSRAESTSTAFKVDINTNEGTFGFTSNNAGVNALNNDYVAYCFHSVSGVSKIGSYNGDTSTVTVTTGFKPSFVMIKRTNQTRDWILFDTVRSGGTSMDDYLTPNSSLDEIANSSIVVNATSTGFTIASGLWAGVNENGGEYLYMAFK